MFIYLIIYFVYVHSFKGPDCKLEHLKILSIGASPVKLQNIDFILQKVKPDVLAGCLYGNIFIFKYSFCKKKYKGNTTTKYFLSD